MLADGQIKTLENGGGGNLFGRRKNIRKATEHAVNSVIPLIQQVGQSDRSKAELWQDSYFLGFLFGTVGSSLAISTGESLSPADSNRVLANTIEQISIHSESGLLRFSNAALSRSEVASTLALIATSMNKIRFRRGAEGAQKLAIWTIGKTPIEDAPLVEEAMALGLKFAEEAEQIGAHLHLANTGTYLGLIKLLLVDQLSSIE